LPALPDNDPNKWKYDLHTRIKHSILMGYLSKWLQILASVGGSVVYVDAFAGRGRYETGQPGSPLLVLSLIQEEMNRTKSSLSTVECHFVEADPANYVNLLAELNQHPASLDRRIGIHSYQAMFSATSDHIVRSITAKGSPSFFFLDPFGYDDPTMDGIGDLLHLPRSEVLVNVMYDFISRAIGVQGNATLAATLDRLFGAPAWGPLAGRTGADREREFVKLYRQQIKAHGAGYAVPFPMADDDRARTLYYLIHATGHFLGAKIMKEVMVSACTSALARGPSCFAWTLRPSRRTSSDCLLAEF
jgi:three-Cys-motif partner protein